MESSPASSSSINSNVLMGEPPVRRYSFVVSLLPFSRLRRLEAGQLAQLLVARAARERHEALARLAPLEPAADESHDRRVQLLGRHPPEQRSADRRLGPEAAADEDVVRLPSDASLVARGRALEAEVADPVLG